MKKRNSSVIKIVDVKKFYIRDFFLLCWKTPNFIQAKLR